jgi:hypothetical protein
MHAVQLFVDLPEELRHSPAQTFHLSAKDVPIHETNDCRVRLSVGNAFGLTTDAFCWSHHRCEVSLVRGKEQQIDSLKIRVCACHHNEHAPPQHPCHDLKAGHQTTYAIHQRAMHLVICKSAGLRP